MIIGLLIAIVVVFGVFGLLVPISIGSDSKRREEEDARRKHPSNYRGAHENCRCVVQPAVPLVQVVDVPLICPVCLTPFAFGTISEFNGEVGGWINLKRHECAGVPA